MLQWLLEPLGFEFMRNALIVGILVGILCPVVGTYLIVQRMALLGDVMAHSVLPGLAIAFFLRVNILIGAFVSGIISAFLIAWIRSQTRIKVDAAMALTFTSFFALGVLLITLLRNKLDLDSFLFGDILGVTGDDVSRTAIISVTVLILIRLFYKELFFYTFDRLGAQAIGLPIDGIYLGLMAAVTLTIIASMQTVGVVLVVALLVGPPTTAYLLVKELYQMMGLGALLGVAASLIGMYASYYLNVPSGPCIVLISFGFFVLAVLFSPSQGLWTRPETVSLLAKIFRKLK
ncbi:MAG: Manganese transport system membrane protein MntB [Chroococcopsis gigantea SAG 12.99]|jgi:manganese/iron transport system permease protein|nr:metal ABC transporter permease [Chlorogloea purpurea SAG 13.99]MDV2999253.1 Manganese transport system membrane protein MntB [Chroococcopsis gigantea SAG 12.99]